MAVPTHLDGKKLTPRERLALAQAAKGGLKQKRNKGKSSDAIRARENTDVGRFILGTSLASVAAIIGVVIWLVILVLTQREGGLVAWGLGALVGGGMLLGYGRTSTTAGIVAGGIALLMIICTKAVPATLIALGAGLLNSVAQTSNVSYDPNFARADLPWMMVDDVHAEAGRDFNDTTWDEDEAARVEAEALVADIPDEELELYWKRQHLAELRFTDARSISMDDLTSEVEDLPRVPYAEIQSDCNGMTLASLDAEIAAWQPPSSGITFGSAFAAMFSPWDILWSLLAVATAFKLAFGDGN